MGARTALGEHGQQKLKAVRLVRRLKRFFLLVSTAIALDAAGTSSATSTELKPGMRFRDCAACPEMVVIAPGAYMMGSTQDERTVLGVPNLFDTMESPRHSVVIAYSFAAGVYAITFEQWDACVAAGGCKGYRPDDAGWGRGKRPVINVNWADAQRYVRWLNLRTGRRYRLLSEAEWEYAARGGTTSYYYFGNTIEDSDANFGGHRGQTTTVGSFPANPFGLYDMTGNTAQWIQDCHHDSYVGAPTDGSPWLTGPCALRNVRGGGWSLEGWSVRAAQRIGDPPDSRNTHLGFRVAVSLTSKP